ncbi:DMT family transporter [Crenobacter cavernae]|uniref:DMT family transporter n=1 Tax=Crenobacter cavernae TaxID=2290923 RepID=A0ABY0FGE9_9NEIS|nr:DMT family transporter [Crenobacter cavernae]RXZ44052.1 DMT family transporter [Crenobacter cavernae]
MPTPSQIRFAALGVLSVALVWGLMWYPFRFLADAGISPQLASFLVYSLVTVMGVALFWRVFREHWRLTKQLAILLVAFGWTNFGYTKAMTDGEVMRALLLFYASPLWGALFSWLVLKEKLTRIGWGVVAVSLAGCVAILWQPGGNGGPWLSEPYEWMALTAGMAFAFGQVVSRHARALPPPVKSSAIWIGTATLGFALSAAHGELARIATIDAWHWGVLASLAVSLICTSVVSQASLSVLPANQVITLMLTELVFAAVSAYAMAGETMTANEWLGGVLIVGASLFSGKMTSKPAPIEAAPPADIAPCCGEIEAAEPAEPPPVIRRRNIEGEATRPRGLRRR